MVEIKNLLPIGTVVRMKGGEKRLMIIGIFQSTYETGEIYDYSAVLYPEGHVGEEQYLFNHDDIECVVFKGFEDEEREAFLNNVELDLESEELKLLKRNHDILKYLNSIKDADDCVTLSVGEIAQALNMKKSFVREALFEMKKDKWLSTKITKNKPQITSRGFAILEELNRMEEESKGSEGWA